VQALALQAPRNLELQRASAQAYDNLHEYAKAEAQYQRLLLRARNGSLSASQQTELLLAAARGRVHAGDFETAAERYRQLLPSCPNDLALRNEFAGVLLAARRPAEAAALYQGVQPDLQGRQLLAVIHMQLHDFDAAEHDCREALRLQPEDPHTEALFAELLSARSDFKQARALFERLLRADPTNRTLQLRLAQTTLADGSYKSAIDLFQALLEGGDSNQREVIRGFIDAAAALPDLGAMHRKAVEALYQRAPTLLAEDAVYLARLAWALCKLEDFDQSIQLLQQARKVAPSDARIRDQLVGALLAADRWRDAIQLLEHERRDRAARELLVSLYLRAQDFPAAERECRALLTENPTDRSTKRLLADILCWRKQYAPALALLEGVARAEPADEELQAHLAEVTLWSGDYATALARYRALPEAVLADPHEWSGYINAAAGAPTLTTADVDRAVHIAERLLDGKPDDPQLLSRLAWILQRGQRKDLSQAVVRKAAALHPKDPALRRELAGVLAVLGENRLAMQMYEGLPLDREDRFRLAGIYSAEKDYDAAEQECRALLRLDAHDSRAQRYLADVLTWKRAYPQALVLWNRLLQADPTNIDLEARRAEVMLWSGDYGEALRDFEALVRKTTDRPSLCRGFVDAAASAKSLTPEQSQLIVQLADRALPELVSDVRFLARLAWVLHQIGEQDRSRRMLEKALALHPPTPGLRRELASVLAAVGMYAEAVQMFEGVDLNVPDRFQLIGIYSADKDFEAAERACRALLQRQPGDAVAERLLADILSWKGKYAEAAALYTKLAQARPQDQGLAIRRAEVTLWSGEYDLALRQYGFLLKRDRGQPRLWASFIDAASSALKLPEEYKPLVLYIEGRTSADSHDPVYLSRLAWVLRRLHEPGQAVGLLQRALALEESSRSLKLQLAETLLEMGRYADAERYFHELMQTKPPPANKK
jgi:tetratricopeptide (TPR) repeat protein